MITAILIFLIVQVLLTGAIAYFSFKRLLKEQQKEILRKVEPVNSEVKLWQSPQEQEEAFSKKLLKEIQNGN